MTTNTPTAPQKAAPVRICAASMPYGQEHAQSPGDGEVPTVMRPGAERAATLPSRGIGA